MRVTWWILLVAACGAPPPPEAMEPPPPAQLRLPELELAEDVLIRLGEVGWEGWLDAPLPLEPTAIGRERIAGWREVLRDQEADAAIPLEVADLYVGRDASAEARAVLSEARLEFAGALRDRGVATCYLAEFDRVLPDAADRLIYRGDPSLHVGTELSPAGKGRAKDYGRLVLEVGAVDAWGAARLAAEAGLVGPAPEDPAMREAWLVDARDLGLRFTAWHEMFHALSRAYLHPNLPASERASQAAWTLASHRLVDVDPSVGFTWGNRSGAAVRLRRAIDERQADGLAFQLMAEHLDLDAAERERAWDVWFGRLERARTQLERVRDELSVIAPDLGPEDLATPIADALGRHPEASDREVLVMLARRLLLTPEIIGHLTPITETETRAVWRALQRPPDEDPEEAGRRRQDRD